MKLLKLLLGLTLISCNTTAVKMNNEIDPRVFEVRKSVVGLLENTEFGKVYNCTGTVVQWDEPRILTAAHCIRDVAPIVYWDGKEYTVEIIGVDDAKDFAILSAPSEIPVTPMSAKQAEVGDTVYSWQSPDGFRPLLSAGIWQGSLKAVYGELPFGLGKFEGFGVVQFGSNNAASGSSVLNAAGEVVGVISAKFGVSNKLDSTVISPLLFK